MTEFKACPFCGEGASTAGPALEQRTPLKSEWRKTLFKVRCGRCGAQTAEFDYEQGPVERWNMRTDPKFKQ